MYVYALDSLLRRTHLFEKFESLIWTERYSSYGDFELLLPSNYTNRRLLTTGTRLAIDASSRVMVVETSENKTDDDGRVLLSVKGYSLEKTLDSRTARQSLSDTTTNPKWVLTGKPGDIVRNLFDSICVQGILSSDDILPFISPGTLFPEDTNTEPQDSITYELSPKDLYSAIKEISDLYDLGFRLVRDYDTSQLFFNVYVGSDRTSNQSTLDTVIFSTDLDNLKNTVELTTISNYKNVAYVFSPVGYQVVYPETAGTDISGFERRVLTVVADDITDEDPTIAAARMVQRGREELSKHRGFSGFDGELYEVSSYVYGQDYFLGDLVEMRNNDGATNYMRVTEQIFVSDSEGDRSYPTLSTSKFISAGSWLSWDYYEEWEDLDPTTYWESV